MSTMEKYKNIFGTAIKVAGKRLEPEESIEVETKTQEIKNLVRTKYLEEVREHDKSLERKSGKSDKRNEEEASGASTEDKGTQ